jgi:hypothetical protein
MTENEMRELDAWISVHVTNTKPTIQARALTADETAMGLWDDELITKKAVREFCEKNPEYHYKECEVWPHYTKYPAAAFEVLKKCADGKTILVSGDKDGNWTVGQLGGDAVFKHETTAETLELAVCLFSKRLFSKP